MADFTQGPWTVEAVNSERLHDICLGYDMPGQGSPIMLATVFHDEEGEGPISARQADANAALIAAAPWMHALLWALRNDWELRPTSLFDEEGVEGVRLSSPDGGEWSWISDWGATVPDFDADAYAAIREASNGAA